MHFVDSVQIRNIGKSNVLVSRWREKRKNLNNTALPAMSPLKKQELTASLASDVPSYAVKVYIKKDYLTYVIL